MKKNLGKGKKIVAAILICALLLAVAAFSFTELPFSAAKIEGTKDYSHAIASVEGITTANPRVIDIAMLGSHDSFTNDIVWNSPVDPDAIGGIEMQTPVKELIWGISRRYAVTQTLDAYDQLRAGARYLDIRLSWFEEEYYTKHGFISAPFQKQAEQILRFLADNKGEVIILNFQQMHFFNQRMRAKSMLWF
ncbi:MAG: hypothetical protein LBN25_04320 [Christensenellaceae bacterium]|jgi:hypothetical protein|nr:hypothetical protein [Christensenellaceae bacterium]